MLCQRLPELLDKLSPRAALAYLVIEERGGYIPVEELSEILHCSQRSAFAYLEQIKVLQNSADVGLFKDQSINNIYTNELTSEIICTCHQIADDHFGGDDVVKEKLIKIVQDIFDPDFPLDVQIIYNSFTLTRKALLDRTKPQIKSFFGYLAGVIRNQYQDQIVKSKLQNQPLDQPICQSSVNKNKESSYQEPLIAPFLTPIANENQEAAASLLELVKNSISDENAGYFLAQIRAIGLRAKHVFFETPDDFVKDWMEARWAKTITQITNMIPVFYCVGQ